MENINFNTLDPDFKHDIALKPGGENIKKCYACGVCTAGCPVFRVEQKYNPRKIIRMILMGMRAEVLSSKEIWLCLRCHTCSANCPQEVDFSNIMMVLRDMAIEEDYASAENLERIEGITDGLNAIRKDCINLMLGNTELSKQALRENADSLIEKIPEKPEIPEKKGK